MPDPAVDQKFARRTQVLTLFSVRARAAGHPVPTEADLTSIATEPDHWQQRITSPEAIAWEETIDHLLKQVKFGVDATAANDQLTADLLRPSGKLPPPTQSPTPGPEQPPPPVEPPEPVATPKPPDLVEELMKWRAKSIADGVDGADSIKDATLRNLVKFNHTEAEQIGKRIGGPAAHLAPQIAAIMAAFNGTPTPPPSTPTPTPPPSQPTPPPAQPRHAAQPTAPQPPPRQPSPPQQTPPRPAARQERRVQATLLNLQHRDFATYEFGDSDVQPTKIRFKTAADGTVSLSFDAYVADAGKMALYRIVSGENSTPYKPESGDLIAVTTGLFVDDPRFFTSAVRTYQVWCHIGRDQEDACRSQPFLFAEGERVSPVDDFTTTEDEGRVIGQWSVFEGTNRVHIYRIPLSGRISEMNEERYRICADDLNLTGFVDTAAERGQRYLYRALAEVTVGDSPRLSKHAQQEVLVSVVLEPVTDLGVSVAGDTNSEFDVSWTTPTAGTVRVYRLPSEPLGGLEGAEVDEDALGPMGLAEESRIKHPVNPVDATTSQMRGVPWPLKWQRAFLVPVTLLNGRARVGKIAITARALPPVTDAELIERLHAEIATFGWPAGAASVKAFVGRSSASPEEICSGAPVAEINEARYERDGGMTFIPPLTATGIAVCLVPVAYSEAAEIRGEITTLQYPGLARLGYKLYVPEGSAEATIWLQSELDIEMPPPLILINNPDRFPLSPDDGTFIFLRPPEGGQGVPQCVLDRIPRHDGWNTGWTADLSRVEGFFRLFFGPSSSPVPMALCDPDLSELWRPPTGVAQ